MKNVLLIITFLIGVIQLQAQLIPQDIVRRINNAQHIFEGEVIRVDGYWNGDNNYIYRSLTLDIRKKFKGTLDCGTVELILNGGQVGNILLDISHNLNLRVGDKGIFLCLESNREQSTVDFFQETNYEVLETIYNAQGFIRFLEDEVNPDVIDYWQFHLDSLAQAYDMVELYTQLSYVDCYPQPIPPDPNNNPIVTLSTSDTSLTYTLDNAAIITYQGNKAYAFDVQLSDSLNNIYFGYASMRFTYDSLTFGTNIYANGRLHVVPSTFLSDTSTYGWSPVTAGDDMLTGNNAAVINTHMNSHPNLVIYNFLPLSTTPVTIARVIIDILDCNIPSTISPYKASSNAVYHYALNPTVFPPIPTYDTVYCVNSLSFPGCGIRYISTITPDTVNAGVGDTVTITGSGFQSFQGTGNVFLKSANVMSMDVPLDAIDILSWSNTQIKFRVPSFLKNAFDNPGTGQLSVKTDSGFVISDIYSWLTIHYGVENLYIDTINEKWFCNLSPINDPVNHSFVFRPDTLTSHHPERLACLSNTIKQWVCVTGVNFKLGQEIDTIENVQDNINSVSFQPMDTSIIGLTNTWKDFSLGNCDEAYIFEIDVAMNKNLLNMGRYLIDTNRTYSVSPNQFDYFETLLHEFGHGCGLTHVNDQNALMYFDSRQNGVAANDRHIKLNYDQSATDGGLYVVSNSLMLDTVQCALVGLKIGTESHCSNVIGINEINKPDIGLSIYPNPASTKINLEYEIEKRSLVVISIYDFSGRVIMSETKLKGTGNFTTEIPIDNLSNGYYIASIRVGNYDYYRKLIKQE